MRPFLRALLLSLPLIPALATCGGGGEPGQPAPIALRLVAVPSGSVASGALVAPEVRIGLVGPDGDILRAADIEVTIELASPGQALAGTTTVLTDVNGIAHFDDLVITGTAGICRFQLTTEGVSPVLTAYFQLIGGAATGLLRLSVDSQLAPVTVAAVPILPGVRVQDQWGNGVGGISVTATVTAGGGTITPPGGGFVTASNGQVTITGWQLGAVPANNRLSVGVTGNGAIPPVEFIVTGVLGPASVVTITAPLASAVVDTTLTAPSTATVTDGRGNRIAGVEVTFHRGAGASLTDSAGVSDDNGEFTPGSWRLAKVAGDNSIFATIPGTISNGGNTYGYPGAPASVHGENTPGRTPVGLPSTVQFRARDKFNNSRPGTQIALAVTTGAGTLLPGSTITTDGTGVAQATITPTAPGPLVVTGSLVVLPDSTAFLTVPVVAPTAMLVVGGDSQAVRAGHETSLPIRIRVVDDSGHAVWGVPVGPNLAWTDSLGEMTFSPVAGGTVGAQRHPVLSPWLPNDTAWATLLVSPNYISIITPVRNGSSAEVGTAVDTLPMVSAGDGFGNIPVGERILWGNGDTTLVDSLGFSSPREWMLGPGAGMQYISVRAVAPGSSQIHFLSALGTPGPVFSIELVQGAGVGGFAGEHPAVLPVFAGSDKFGNSTPSQPVTVAITSGAGTLTPVPVSFDTTGKVTVPGWTLGLGSNELTVSANGKLRSLVINAGAASDFHIALRGVPALYAQDFAAAVFRWRRVVRNDLPSQSVSVGAGDCGPGAFTGTVDDLAIDVVVGGIDGPGGILGGAGPCVVRASGGLPAFGVMIFDESDIGGLIAAGTLDDVLLHEMGHVLGIGSLWNGKGLVITTGDPHYTGANGLGQFLALGGGSYGGAKVPIEANGGPGTAYVHWRESVMPSELMTGYLSAAFNPLSTITAASLTDLGYAVDLSQADAYTLFTAPPLDRAAPGVRVNDLIHGPKFEARPNGMVVPLPVR